MAFHFCKTTERHCRWDEERRAKAGRYLRAARRDPRSGLLVFETGFAVQAARCCSWRLMKQKQYSSTPPTVAGARKCSRRPCGCAAYEGRIDPCPLQIVSSRFLPEPPALPVANKIALLPVNRIENELRGCDTHHKSPSNCT